MNLVHYFVHSFLVLYVLVTPMFVLIQKCCFEACGTVFGCGKKFLSYFLSIVFKSAEYEHLLTIIWL